MGPACPTCRGALENVLSLKSNFSLTFRNRGVCKLQAVPLGGVAPRAWVRPPRRGCVSKAGLSVLPASGLEARADVPGPVRERPAGGSVTSAWGWGGSVWIWEAVLWGGGGFQLEGEGWGSVLPSFTAHPSGAPAPRPPFAVAIVRRGAQPALRATWIRPETESLGAPTWSHLLGTVLER